MKVPETELVSKVRIVFSAAGRDQVPRSAIPVKYNGELSAKDLWHNSVLQIDQFYKQLKIEMAKGWIKELEMAVMKEVEAG